MTTRTITHEEWKAEGVRRFGADQRKWAFVCPSCGHVATVADWIEAGADEGEVAYSCVGRRRGVGGEKAFKKSGGPCNYAGGGLFKLNPVQVTFGDGVRETFEFAGDLPAKVEASTS